MMRNVTCTWLPCGCNVAFRDSDQTPMGFSSQCEAATALFAQLMTDPHRNEAKCAAKDALHEHATDERIKLMISRAAAKREYDAL